MVWLLLFLSIFIASIPMFFLLWLVWWLDRYEREPIWLVGLTFLWGAFGGVFLGALFGMIFTLPVSIVFGAEAGSAVGAVIFAPLVEEPAKGLILLLIVFNRNFDNATDGFVYGGATGLGFGMVENFMYFALGSLEGDPMQFAVLAVMRTLFTAPMHMLASSCFGATLGYAKWIRRAWAYVLLPPLGLGIGMTIHFLWNLFAVTSGFFAEFYMLPMALSILIFGAEMLLIFTVFQVSLFGESRMIRRELAKEADVGVIPAAHVPHIASTFGRFGRKWLPRGIKKGRYIRTATTLAFRIAERDRCAEGGSQRQFYDREVGKLREEIRAMLAPTHLARKR